MEDFNYKLVMFGFSALCEDLEEVKRRLSIYPAERYNLENGDECFLVNLSTRQIYPILLKNNRFVIDGL
ncbi:hypothetical protein [Helicobacter sp.]|uniref:hypothetical protein n=1 Tax=Helicobacter sp. TaxID=218 RepID=UPI0025BA244F|nr:hypothetical protein [Helicobacter sp.]MCI5968533.1 hypothetical protein [Helicobacter sp.]MDY2584743.1 hypothetical protein [Helicobacter sp.]